MSEQILAQHATELRVHDAIRASVTENQKASERDAIAQTIAALLQRAADLQPDPVLGPFTHTARIMVNSTSRAQGSAAMTKARLAYSKHFQARCEEVASQWEDHTKIEWLRDRFEDLALLLNEHGAEMVLLAFHSGLAPQPATTEARPFARLMQELA